MKLLKTKIICPIFIFLNLFVLDANATDNSESEVVSESESQIASNSDAQVTSEPEAQVVSESGEAVEGESTNEFCIPASTAGVPETFLEASGPHETLSFLSGESSGFERIKKNIGGWDYIEWLGKIEFKTNATDCTPSPESVENNVYYLNVFRKLLAAIESLDSQLDDSDLYWRQYDDPKDEQSTNGKMARKYQISSLRSLTEAKYRSLLGLWALTTKSIPELTSAEISIIRSALDRKQWEDFESKNADQIKSVGLLSIAQKAAERRRFEDLSLLVASSRATDSERDEFKKLLAKVDAGEHEDAEYNIPMRDWSSYPKILNRFYIGSDIISTDEFADDANLTLGHVYYRAPYARYSEERWHFHNDIGLTSIKNSDDEATYTIREQFDLFWGFYKGEKSQEKGDAELITGLVIKLGLNVYEGEATSYEKETGENDDDGNPMTETIEVPNELLYLGRYGFGFRSAYSPEQYTELSFSKCVAVPVKGRDYDKCYFRANLGLFMVAPISTYGSNVQLGVKFDYKLNDEDPYSSSIIASIRYQTSFTSLLGNFMTQ